MLYALSVADLTMLVALVFVLARNVIKLLVERRRALPFARFRAKLVAVLLGMTLIPSVLVLIVGSEVIRTSADRWFNAPMDEVLSSANTIASDYYHDGRCSVSDHARRASRGCCRRRDLGAGDVRRVRDLRRARGDAAAAADRRGVPRRARRAGGPPQVVPVIDVASPALPPGYIARLGRSPRRARRGGRRRHAGRSSRSRAAGSWCAAAALVRAPAGRPAGVVVATDLLSGRARRARRAA